MSAHDMKNPKATSATDSAEGADGSPDDAIPIKDLTPRRDVTGGSAKLLFGETPLDDPGASNKQP
jgi:hypothetical protein